MVSKKKIFTFLKCFPTLIFCYPLEIMLQQLNCKPYSDSELPLFHNASWYQKATVYISAYE